MNTARDRHAFERPSDRIRIVPPAGVPNVREVASRVAAVVMAGMIASLPEPALAEDVTRCGERAVEIRDKMAADPSYLFVVAEAIGRLDLVPDRYRTPSPWIPGPIIPPDPREYKAAVLEACEYGTNRKARRAAKAAARRAR